MFLKPVESEEQVGLVERLASEIWREYYPTIISLAQIEYMLISLQSKDAILQQQAQGVQYRLILVNSEPLGYIAYCVDVTYQRLFISKFYLLKYARGQGLAIAVLAEIEAIAFKSNIYRLDLMVNKQNHRAIHCYLKFGFVQSGEVITEIGNGFVMDDYRMSKYLMHNISLK
jgi:diamine N-acetyltransferase